jgi:hypothetical protein
MDRSKFRCVLHVGSLCRGGGIKNANINVLLMEGIDSFPELLCQC